MSEYKTIMSETGYARLIKVRRTGSEAPMSKDEELMLELHAGVERLNARELEWRSTLRDLHVEMAAAKTERDQLKSCEAVMRSALQAAKRSHHICEDPWYSCPLSGEWWANEREAECNCGADEHNADIDKALAQVAVHHTPVSPWFPETVADPDRDDVEDGYD